MNLTARSSNSKHKKQAIATAIVCSMLLLLPSCIPILRRPEPLAPLPADNGPPNSENSAQLRVDEFYNDSLLLGLIAQALANNQELKILNENIQIASNEILLRRGTYLPFVTAGGGPGLNKASLFSEVGAGLHDDQFRPGQYVPNPYGDFLLGLNLFWQIDIWRQLRNARDAAVQRYIAATDERNYFVTRLIAEVAENYYTLMMLGARLDNLNRIIELQERSLEIANSRMLAARGTALPVQRFLGAVRKNQSQKLIVNQDIIQAENRINFLLGRFPQPVERTPVNSSSFTDLQLHALSLGVPSQLLLYRPDIRKAERELAAAGLDVKVARARFLPTVTLSSGVGYEAFDMKYLFITPEALIYNIAGGIVGPVINFKAIQADYLSSNAKQLQTVYNYQRVIINAFTEVINRVSKVENYGRSIAIKRQQVAALQAAVEAATSLYQLPRAEQPVNYLDVLTAQNDLFEAIKDLIDTKGEQLFAIVNTYQALGGGGYLFPTAPPVKHPPVHHHWWEPFKHPTEDEIVAGFMPPPPPPPVLAETGQGPVSAPPPPGGMGPGPLPAPAAPGMGPGALPVPAGDGRQNPPPAPAGGYLPDALPPRAPAAPGQQPLPALSAPESAQGPRQTPTGGGNGPVAGGEG